MLKPVSKVINGIQTTVMEAVPEEEQQVQAPPEPEAPAPKAKVRTPRQTPGDVKNK